jgi:hypothetical protein
MIENFFLWSRENNLERLYLKSLYSLVQWLRVEKPLQSSSIHASSALTYIIFHGYTEDIKKYVMPFKEQTRYLICQEQKVLALTPGCPLAWCSS